MTQLPKSQLDQLKAFVTLLKINPAILDDPDLSFFREYLVSVGAKLPETAKDSQDDKIPTPDPAATHEPEKMDQDEPEEPESDLELDMAGVVDLDLDPAQEMGNCNDTGDIEISEEKMDEFNTKRANAMNAFGDADWSKAVDLFTEAILINSKSAAVYAKRGNCFLKLNRPNACIRDCDRAIKINPDSAAAYKFRGRANRLLGRFVEAAKDLRVACKLDFDEIADEWLKEVTPNAKKIEEHERKKQRKREENEIKQKKEKIQKARQAREEAYKKQKEAPNTGLPKGMGGMFQDKEVMAAFQDILSNPGNISKYQNNPKIMSALGEMMSQMGGGSVPGMPGMGGIPGMGGMPGMGGIPEMGGKNGGAPFGHNHNSSEGTKPNTDLPKKPNTATTTDDLD